MDMTYATIPVFSQPRRLYRETHMKYMVSSQEKPDKSPLYSIHTDLDSFILYNDENLNEQGELDNKSAIGKGGRREKGSKQFDNLENHNKHDKDHKQQTNHQHSAVHKKQIENPQHNGKHEEQEKTEHSVDPKKQHSQNKQNRE